MTAPAVVIDCTIEKGIPIPEARSLRHARLNRPRRYRLDEMAPGDSFFVQAFEGEELSAIKESLRVRFAQRKHRNREAGRFLMRYWIDGGGAVGLRIWRVA